MGKIIKAGAWCNGEVAYLAWQADAPIEDCLGFMITRVHETGPDAGQRRVLPTWIAFIDQSNPDWQDQDSGVWPIQQYQWRDLTLRRSRDTAAVRPIDFRVHYEIVPVGLAGDDRAAIPDADVAPFMDAAGKPRYQGPRHPLGILAAPFRTDAIDVTHRYGKAGIEATFTNGILSTQNLLRQLEAVQGSKPDGVKAGPTLGVTKGLLRTLTDHIPIENDDIRRFLTADVLSLLLKLLDRAEQGDGELFLALYELHDPQLIGRLTRLVEAGKAHVVLSTAGSTDLNAKGAAPPRIPLIWDSENHDARESLHAAGPANVEDRLFNNQQHIGHNKFIVYAEKGVAKAVATGSTNWTETGLCTQTNNVIIIEDEALAAHYLEYWRRLKADTQPAGIPASGKNGKGMVDGFAPNLGRPGAGLRADNAEPAPSLTLSDGSRIETFFSPNTKAQTKNKKSPTPIDLARVYALMEHAQQAILFLTFFPGVGGEQNIIGQAAEIVAKRPDLLVQGAISNPQALPADKAGKPTTFTTADGRTAKLPERAIWWPGGDSSHVVMIRAAAITTKIGDLRPELLSAGHAIIHDKIIVIDPLDPVNCTVITGSHNLGYKASYQNDENLLIIRGNQPLAIAYAIHVLDTYDHYVMRARLQEDRRQALIKTGKEPAASSGGFLKLTPAWQRRWFKDKAEPSSRDYFLSV